jgi:3',5'-cyclic AMP phosphodiesterase CpdA
MNLSRREFLAAAGAAAVSLGFPRRASWALADGPRESLRIAFFTDIHARVEWDTPIAMELAAEKINAQKADLVICGGDCITDGFDSPREAVADRWRAYREHLADRLSIRPITAIGNHDFVGVIPKDGSEPEADPRAAFKEELGEPETIRAVDAGGCRILVLDCVDITRDELNYRGFIDGAQIAWLRDEISRTPETVPIILVTHMPLLTTFFQATEGGESAAPRNRIVVNNREVLDLIVDRRSTVVLQGHLHVDEILRWRGVTFITGGAICGKWWRGAWMGTEPGFGVMTWRRDRVDWEYVPLGWVARRP